MNYQPSALGVIIFFVFIISVLLISRYFSKRTSSSAGFYTAGGHIHWSVNGIAFAGDYLSAASFLGICGMIAVYGFDGFLYSIGYLAGWMVALFVIAEPLKRMGKYTFADALDSKFKSKGIRITAGISTLIVSLFYLIPQMVGAGSLVTPLLGWPHWVGVILVGIVVIIIVATAGMASTTYVQFLKGSLLIIFSIVLVIMVLGKGLKTTSYETLAVESYDGSDIQLVAEGKSISNEWKAGDKIFFEVEINGKPTIWSFNKEKMILEETLFITNLADGSILYNGAPKEDERFRQVGDLSEIGGEKNVETGSLGMFKFIGKIKNATVIRWNKVVMMDGENKLTIFYQNPTPGKEVLVTGQKFPVKTGRDKMNFISLMLALFFGTAALPHILIRYYTVSSPAAARKSTIVAIMSIGLFYILTLFMGLGSMTSGVLDLTNSNMAAPLLARSFSVAIFAIISAVAFATVLGTVSGLIVASSGAVVHDLVGKISKKGLSDKKQVSIGKLAAVIVGGIAIVLGIVFKGMNVSFLVGWAFAVAASANLPAIVMVLFWKGTTAKGVVSSIIVGLVSAMTIILLSQTTYDSVYHLVGVKAPMPIDNPAIITVPLSFITLVVVSLITKKKEISK
ncbi:MAG: cation acetate symporter [Candidatus Marinimicrobia bacterium]|nr:cation acetate symporter [Candidatus Neomarinimicrobiota bacterium]